MELQLRLLCIRRRVTPSTTFTRSRACTRGLAHFDVARAVLREFGWSSAESKEQPPSESVDALGVTVFALIGFCRAYGAHTPTL